MEAVVRRSAVTKEQQSLWYLIWTCQLLPVWAGWLSVNVYKLKTSFGWKCLRWMKCHIVLSLVEKFIKLTSSLVSVREAVTEHNVWNLMGFSSSSGLYVCSECGHELFSSSSKFEHSSPWPSFSETVHKDSVSKHPEAWGPIKVYSQEQLWLHGSFNVRVFLFKLSEITILRFVAESVGMDWATSSWTMDQDKDSHASESSAAHWRLSLKVICFVCVQKLSIQSFIYIVLNFISFHRADSGGLKTINVPSGHEVYDVLQDKACWISRALKSNGHQW